jgi:2,4-dienoyl-CoA reductase-like NADH-dependent reductase (Old Yellow Enzyme family)
MANRFLKVDSDVAHDNKCGIAIWPDEGRKLAGRRPNVYFLTPAEIYLHKLMTSQLFRPFSLRSVTLPNRIVISPMCQYSAVDGNATDWHTIHLGQLAFSGAGMLIVEATGVELAGRISPGCLALGSDENEAALARVLVSVRRYSSMLLAIQLGHAGRKASSQVPWEGGRLLQSGGWQTVAPSPIPHQDGDPVPQMLDTAGIARITAAFVDATRRAARLGFDAIELHMAHGYLLHQFLSPIANRRDDTYGGRLENRMRFPLEVFAAVRAVWPTEKPLGVRISATDWVSGGWDIEQSVVFAQALKRLGCDWIDASSGGISPQQQMTIGPGFQVPFAERLRHDTGLPSMAVGLITEPEQAENIIASGAADMVALGRSLLWNPHWPWQAATKLGAQTAAPQQYHRSVPQGVPQIFEQG